VRTLGVFALLCAVGCSRAVTPPLEVAKKGDLPKVAVLAIVPVTPSAAITGDAALRAPEAVSAMLASAAAGESAWTLAPSAKVRAAVDSVPAGDVENRAGSVAAKVGAGAALTAIVRHYEERKGSDYGASDGATVSLKVLLVPAGAKAAVWSADYSFHQVPLTYNLWNFWEVQRAGLRWHTADELAEIGVQEAVKRLAASLP